jgi:glutamate-1-semialdehyde 2,1-aminomutase
MGFGALFAGHMHPAVCPKKKKKNYSLLTRRRLTLFIRINRCIVLFVCNWNMVLSTSPRLVRIFVVFVLCIPSDSPTLFFFFVSSHDTERNSEVGELLAERYGLPMWRYTNSGTEATMDAIRVARGATGRQKIVKIEGGYHGHHDEVMISTKPPLDLAGPADAPNSVPACLGITTAVLHDTVVVPFNNIVAMERALKARDVACVIMEPVMENIGICLPIPGYLEAVREMTTRFGTLLIFDEVKTGITAGYGGATNVLGVRPDLIALAKSIGGGFPFGAFGGKQEYMDLITQGKVLHLGTYNGNPLVMAATKATLTEACTRDAVEVAISRNTRLTQSCEDVVREFQLPAHTVQFGAKGCVTWSTKPVHNYRDYKQGNFILAYAQWIHGINRGVLLPPGLDEQWLVSVMHDDEDALRFAHVFREFAQDLRSSTPVASLESKLVAIRSRL